MKIYDYQIENTKTKISNMLKDSRLRLKTWENVKRITKKDGSDFKNFNMNFDGAELDPRFKSMHSLMTHWVDGTDFVEDSIWVDKTSCNGLFTIDEVFEKIEQRKKDLRVQIAELEHDLQNYDKLINELTAITETIVKALDIDAKSIYTRSEINDLLGSAFKGF